MFSEKYTLHIRIVHQDPETVQNHDRSLERIYTTIELSTMSLIEMLKNLFNHDFSIIANSTNFSSTTKFQEFMFLRTKGSHDPMHCRKKGFMSCCKPINPFLVYQGIKNGFSVYYSPDFFFSVAVVLYFQLIQKLIKLFYSPKN